MNNAAQIARKFLFLAVDAVLPPRCPISGEIVETQGMAAPAAWAGLNFITAPMCACCGAPFEFEAGEGAQCVHCLDDRPPFEVARAALKYDDASRSVILGFKHGDKTHAAPAFIPWLKRAGAEILREADCLIPVPLHRWRLISRRYNQAALIAFALGKESGIEVLPQALIRTRPTPSQGHMKAKERMKNVRGAFAFDERFKDRIVGKNIVLVDDVYTTGATVRECAKVLIESGARKVHVLTLARIARAGQF